MPVRPVAFCPNVGCLNRSGKQSFAFSDVELEYRHVTCTVCGSYFTHAGPNEKQYCIEVREATRSPSLGSKRKQHAVSPGPQARQHKGKGQGKGKSKGKGGGQAPSHQQQPLQQQHIFQAMPSMGANVFVQMPGQAPAPRTPCMYMNNSMSANIGPSMWNPPYNAAPPTHPAVPNIGSDFEKLKAFFAEQLAPEQRELIMGLNPAPTPLSHAHVQQLKSDYENTYYELGLAKTHMCELIQRVDEQEAIVNDLEEQVSTKKLVWTDAEIALFSQVNQSADIAPATSNAQTFRIDTPINLTNLNKFTPEQLQELSQHCANLANQRSQLPDDPAMGGSGGDGGDSLSVGGGGIATPSTHGFPDYNPEQEENLMTLAVGQVQSDSQIKSYKDRVATLREVSTSISNESGATSSALPNGGPPTTFGPATHSGSQTPGLAPYNTQHS